MILVAAFASAATAAGAEPGTASSQANRIRMDVWRRPLREVAAQLAQRTSVDILIPAAIENIEVSASLIDLDARGALQSLLAHHSYMLIERNEHDSDRRGRAVIEIILFGAAAKVGVGPTAAPVRVTALEDRSVDELVQVALAATPASERAAAVDAIAYRDSESSGQSARAEPVLSSALIDPAEEVRAQAIATLKDTADRIPFDALSQVAREDASADLRIQALELLVERSENGESRAPIAVALNDGDAKVRRRARELMLDWHIDVIAN